MLLDEEGGVVHTLYLCKLTT